ncbi:NO signaling/Golgi transport ligand-binding domain-containing protein [Crepidotus variabilis]|uniref:NO signaling/Golgi transport ligand-binding domain-containing protein n=1 Tax=Crepidotus variabilis TaxID=179855 RepID=A0A9P6JPP2_9AGAR|nr:NO signaling/Golgi transport ligand-binding domain-containing protein [Crepidotus variabilis]
MSTPTLTSLSTPSQSLIDAHLMDYFLIELVATLRTSAGVAQKRQRKVESEMRDAGLVAVPAAGNNPPNEKKKDRERDRESREGSARDSVTSLSSTKGGSHKQPNKDKDPLDEEDEPVRQRLEAIGVHVGANVAERLSATRPPFTDTLDAIKFICKDVWAACWDKQIDNLRTNHRGIYVLQDNAFSPITRLSSHISRSDAVRRAKIYAHLPAGIIKGVLTRLGVSSSTSSTTSSTSTSTTSANANASGSNHTSSAAGGGGVSVTPEISSMPQCTFQVKLPKGS